MYVSEFYSVGKKLFDNGLIANASGNLSIRQDDFLIITRTGSLLRDLRESDLIRTDLFQDDEATPLASSELCVHREIFKQTEAKAIVHAHVPCATTLSMNEALLGCPEIPSGVPVIGWQGAIRAGAYAELIALALREQSLVMVYGHGSFAVADTLEQAYEMTLEFERYCCSVCCDRSLEVDPEKLPKL